MEESLLEKLEELLLNIKEDKNNPNSLPLFKKVIANNAPIWTAVETTPSVCFYLESTTYDDSNCGLRYNGNSNIILYVYNKHKARGLSLKDILSPLITRIRAEVKTLPTIDGNILDAYISSVKRDAGTVLPFTIAELTLSINFVELKTCIK